MVGKGGERRTLAKIRAAFLNLRRQRGRQRAWYPEELKTLALEALGSGLSQAEVAQAAGVCVSSIRNWKNDGKSPATKKSIAPVELKLVERREAASLEGPSASMIRGIPSGEAKIRFRSGVSIELPASCLTQDLLGALMRGAP